MNGRGGTGAAVLLAAVVVAGAIALQSQVGPRVPGGAQPGTAPSGAWFCPHGGGSSDWQVTLTLANPGNGPVEVRIRALGAGKPEAPKTYSVPPRSQLQVPAAADGRERASLVEYFGGWVGAGWVSRAGGDESGVAAEPCLAQAGPAWVAPGGSTEQGQDAYLIVMNPFAADAIVKVTLLTDDSDPISTKKWSNVVIRPFRSLAFHLNDNALGRATVSAEVEASLGRVAVATLGIAANGGIQSSVGMPAPLPSQAIMLGAGDAGRSDVIVSNVGERKLPLSARLLTGEGPAPAGGLQSITQDARRSATYQVLTEDASAIVLRGEGPGGGFAAARRTFSSGSNDQGDTTAVSSPAGAWVLPPATTGDPAHPAIVLANPGSSPVEVTLSALAPADGGNASPPEPVNVTVPPSSAVAAPSEFAAGAAGDTILAVASSGTFVAASASYSLGQEGLAGYAAAAGIAVPAGALPG